MVVNYNFEISGVKLLALTHFNGTNQNYDTLVVKDKFEICSVQLPVLTQFNRTYKVYDTLVATYNFEIWVFNYSF